MEQPQNVTSAEPVAATAEVEYVGFWLRLVASLIDTVVAGIVLALIGSILGLGSIEFDGNVDSLLANPHYARGQLIQHVILAALIVWCWLRFAATPGKRVIGAEVVDAKTFGKLGTGQAIVRYLSYYVSTLVCFLGFIWIAIDARKQGWHDKIAGTVVIRKKA